MSAVHMCMSLRGVLKNKLGNKTLAGLFTKNDGTDCSHNEAIDYISDCLSKGWRVIPMGDCPKFDYQDGCQCYK